MEYKGKLYCKVGKNYFPLEETTKDVDNLRKKAIKYDELLNIVGKQMEDNESDLSVIGELVVGALGYYG